MHLTGCFELPGPEPRHQPLGAALLDRHAPGPESDGTVPCLTANSDGTSGMGFGVGRGFLTPELGLFATPGEAVARAVCELSLGPGSMTD